MWSPFDAKPFDFEPLNRALAECGIGPDQIEHVAKRLVRVPLAIGRSAAGDPKPGATIQLGGKQVKLPTMERAFDADIDGDMAAFLLRFNEGNPDPNARWNALSRLERKKARRLWDWVGRFHGLCVTPQGRPPVIDPTLVLYCARVLCEAPRLRKSAGSAEFQFRRPAGGGAPGGPLWRALLESLPLAQQFLAIRVGYPANERTSTKNPHNSKAGDHPEAIAEIITLARSKAFKNVCETLALGPKSEDVGANPTTFRLAVVLAREMRSQRRPQPPIFHPGLSVPFFFQF
jgi:hypothetical protein